MRGARCPNPNPNQVLFARLLVGVTEIRKVRVRVRVRVTVRVRVRVSNPNPTLTLTP